MEILAMSRARVIQYCQMQHRHSSVIISISDPNMDYSSSPFMTLENHVAAILPLCFCDADRPGTDVYGNETDVLIIASSTIVSLQSSLQH